MMEQQISENERAILDYFGVAPFVWESGRIWDAYRLAVDVAFRTNDQSEMCNKLRRAYNAFCDHNPYRMTPEFEALIA